MDILDYIEQCRSEENYTPEMEQELTEKYYEYIEYLNERAQEAMFESAMEM